MEKESDIVEKELNVSGMTVIRGNKEAKNGLP